MVLKIAKKKGVTNQFHTDDPFLNAERSVNTVLGTFTRQRDLWQFLALISLVITGIAVCGLIYTINQSRLVPVIVEMGRLGNVERVFRLEEHSNIDDKLLVSVLSHFIKNIRTVIADRDLKADQIKAAFSLIPESNPAFDVLADYFKDNNPLDGSRPLTNVTVQRVQSVGPLTWQLQWYEQIRDQENEVLPVTYSAILTLDTQKLNTNSLQDIKSNPLGLLIKDIQVNRVEN